MGGRGGQGGSGGRKGRRELGGDSKSGQDGSTHPAAGDIPNRPGEWTQQVQARLSRCTGASWTVAEDSPTPAAYTLVPLYDSHGEWDGGFVATAGTAAEAAQTARALHDWCSVGAAGSQRVSVTVAETDRRQRTGQQGPRGSGKGGGRGR